MTIAFLRAAAIDTHARVCYNSTHNGDDGNKTTVRARREPGQLKTGGGAFVHSSPRSLSGEEPGTDAPVIGR